MPSAARVWIFAAREPLSGPAQERVLQRTDQFLAGWAAHGRPVTGAREVKYDRFLVVAADEAASGVSGCSIDSLFHALAETERETGTTLTDQSLVWFRNSAGEIEALSRSEFRQLVRDGGAGADTTVFDHTIATVGDLSGGRWELPLRDSWHAQAFSRRA